MRKLIVHEFVSLDGVMQAPGGKDEDRDGGFEHGQGESVTRRELKPFARPGRMGSP
jgi:hypothetical protein